MDIVVFDFRASFFSLFSLSVLSLSLLTHTLTLFSLSSNIVTSSILFPHLMISAPLEKTNFTTTALFLPAVDEEQLNKKADAKKNKCIKEKTLRFD